MSASDLLSATGALLLVVGLIVLLRFGARFIRPRGAGGANSRLGVAAQLGLDAKRRLHLVACDGRFVLVLSGGASDVMLPWPPASGAEAP